MLDMRWPFITKISAKNKLGSLLNFYYVNKRRKKKKKKKKKKKEKKKNTINFISVFEIN